MRTRIRECIYCYRSSLDICLCPTRACVYSSYDDFDPRDKYEFIVRVIRRRLNFDLDYSTGKFTNISNV